MFVRRCRFSELTHPPDLSVAQFDKAGSGLQETGRKRVREEGKGDEGNPDR